MEVPLDSFSDQIRVVTACDQPGGGQPD
jgi:hypothetical protein